MIAYTSRTGTASTLHALRAAGWRLLVSAAADHRHEGMPYAIDNGAWAYHQRGVPFDENRFARLVQSHGERADWVVCPDKVADARATLEMAAAWLPRLPLSVTPKVLIAVQDGMTPADLEVLVRPHSRIGIFLGGSTEWKLATMTSWGAWCRGRGTYYHVARVNTSRRMRLAHDAWADSVDGTSPIQFPTTLPKLDRARRASTLFREADAAPPRNYAADAELVERELVSYRDDDEVTLEAGALRELIARMGVSQRLVHASEGRS